jgi:hypothetical protein
VLAHIADGSLREFYFISDLLYIPAFFEDLTRWSGTAADWRLPPAPYYFPDMMLYAAARSAGLSIEWSQYASGIALLLLVIGAARWAITNAAPELKHASACVAVLFASALALQHGRAFNWPSQLTVISCHGGAALATFLSLALCFSSSRWARHALIALALISGASDPLYAASCSVAPLTLLHPSARARSIKALAAAVAAAAGVALTSVTHVESTAHYVQPRPARSLAAYHQLIADMNGAAFNETVYLTVSVVLACHVALRHSKRQSASGIGALALFHVGTVVSTLGAMVLTGRHSGMGTLRYLIIPFASSLMFLGAMLAHALQDARAAQRALALAAVTAFAVSGWRAAPVLAHGQYIADIRKQIPCISAAVEEADASFVLTDYWHAKPLLLMSGGHLHAVQMTADLAEPRWWINSKHWYRGSRTFGTILTNDLSSDAIEASYGAPSEITHCGSYELFVYRGEARVRLSHSISAALARFFGSADPR